MPCGILPETSGKGLAMHRLLACLLLLFPGAVYGEPLFSTDGPDAAAYGEGEGYPVGTRLTLREQRYLVGSLSNHERLFDSRKVSRGASASALAYDPAPLALSYQYQGSERSLTDYLARHPTTGLLIAQGDRILYEHYRYGRTDRDRFTSQSMAKTVTAMLIGIAVDEGLIRSIDEPAQDYAPALAGNAYGATPIRALLHMASGNAFTESYDGSDDVSRMARELFRRGGPETTAVVRLFDRREVAPNTRWHYAGIETLVLGLVLRQASGMSVADYLSSRVWQPMGAEADATWTIDTSGQEVTFCCLNAVLRDYARLGLLLANDGAIGDRQIIPRQWVLDATSVPADKPFLAPGKATPFLGYGYQTWLMSGPDRVFALLGIHGQVIYVHPGLKLVMVHTAARTRPAGDPAGAETAALWRALVTQRRG